MSFEEILKEIKVLANSQGFYGRLYESIMESEESQEQFKNIVEEQNFNDIVDFIIWIEG